MSRVLLFILYIIFFGVQGFSQSKTSTEEIIKEIKNKYNIINYELPSYKIEGFSIDHSEGGEGKAYFKDGILQRLEVLFYFETGKQVCEYYLSNNSVFFAYRQLYKYNYPFYIEPDPDNDIEGFNPDKTTKQEIRYYFNNGKPIRLLHSTYGEITSHSEQYSKLLNEFASEWDLFYSLSKS